MHRSGRITLQIKRKIGDRMQDKNQKRTTTTYCTNMENISGKYSWRSNLERPAISHYENIECNKQVVI